MVDLAKLPGPLSTASVWQSAHIPVPLRNTEVFEFAERQTRMTPAFVVFAFSITFLALSLQIL
jgi:hypothetical protein